MVTILSILFVRTAVIFQIVTVVEFLSDQTHEIGLRVPARLLGGHERVTGGRGHEVRGSAWHLEVMELEELISHFIVRLIAIVVAI